MEVKYLSQTEEYYKTHHVKAYVITDNYGNTGHSYSNTGQTGQRSRVGNKVIQIFSPSRLLPFISSTLQFATLTRPQIEIFHVVLLLSSTKNFCQI